MRESLDKLKKALDEAVALPESTPEEELFEKVSLLTDVVLAVRDDVVRAAESGEPLLITELAELRDAFELRWKAPWFPLKKHLYRIRELMKETLERLRFVELSRGTSAPCGCAPWRTVANGGGLSAVPTFPSSRVVEEVNEMFENYRVHECGSCGSQWLQDFNPDSDPSVTRWWAR